MTEIIDYCRSIYKKSAFACENLSFSETLRLICDWQGVDFDPIILPKLTLAQRNAVKLTFEKAVSGYPLQYITKTAWFYKSAFYVEEEVLIPRRDSEILVSEAVRLIPKNSTFLDLCTGSGCIGISVLSERPDLSAVLVDISQKALEIAKKNAQFLKVEKRCDFLQFDLLTNAVSLLPAHDAVIMNPPYLTSRQMKEIPENVAYEPMLALNGGEDGLDFYRLFSESGKLLIFEIGSGQKEDILKIFSGGEIVYDLSKNPRVFIKNDNKEQ